MIEPDFPYNAMEKALVHVNVPTPSPSLTTLVANENRIYTPSSPYVGYSEVDVQVPLPLIEETKSKTAVSNGNAQYSTTIIPTPTYAGVAEAIVNTNNMDMTFNVICTSTPASYTSTYYDYNYYGYTAPSNDNSTTSLQNLFDFYIKSNSVYSGINKATLKGRIQHRTITSNGTYYPYNTSTFIRKIVVNVSPSLQTIVITSNGTYTPSSSYDGYNEVVVKVPTIPVIKSCYCGSLVKLSNFLTATTDTTISVSRSKTLVYLTSFSGGTKVGIFGNPSGSNYANLSIPVGSGSRYYVFNTINIVNFSISTTSTSSTYYVFRSNNAGYSTSEPGYDILTFYDTMANFDYNS